MLHCDGYSAYGRIENVILICCLAHCRRKFFEAIPAERRKKWKLLDINSEQELEEPKAETSRNRGSDMGRVLELVGYHHSCRWK